MIKIKPSPTADTRTCDVTKVTKEQLLESSVQHVKDVHKGFDFLIQLLEQQASRHDQTKIINIDEFYADFKTGFKSTTWWEMHQQVERHHFNNPQFIQEDVNLIDVLDQIVDGVMAGMARSGVYRQEPMSPELLVKAYNNTIKLMLANVEVEK